MGSLVRVRSPVRRSVGRFPAPCNGIDEARCGCCQGLASFLGRKRAYLQPCEGRSPRQSQQHLRSRSIRRGWSSRLRTARRSVCPYDGIVVAYGLMILMVMTKEIKATVTQRMTRMMMGLPHPRPDTAAKPRQQSRQSLNVGQGALLRSESRREGSRSSHLGSLDAQTVPCRHRRSVEGKLNTDR